MASPEAQLVAIIRTDCTSTLRKFSSGTFMRAPVAVVVGAAVVALSFPFFLLFPAFDRPVTCTWWPTCGARSVLLLRFQVVVRPAAGAFAPPGTISVPGTPPAALRNCVSPVSGAVEAPGECHGTGCACCCCAPLLRVSAPGCAAITGANAERPAIQHAATMSSALVRMSSSPSFYSGATGTVQNLCPVFFVSISAAAELVRARISVRPSCVTPRFRGGRS